MEIVNQSIPNSTSDAKVQTVKMRTFLQRSHKYRAERGPALEIARITLKYERANNERVAVTILRFSVVS